MARLMIIALFSAAFLVSGCAGIQPPNPEEILKHPLGTESVRLGMSKHEVESKWGRPDEIRQVEDKKMWKGPREEWIYRPSYGSAIPIDAGYLSKTKRLYFDGNNLTDMKE